MHPRWFLILKEPAHPAGSFFASASVIAWDQRTIHLDVDIRSEFPYNTIKCNNIIIYCNNIMIGGSLACESGKTEFSQADRY